MDRNIDQLIAAMTLEEKAGLCSGESFWTTKAIDRLGVPSILMTDGPHGVRKQAGDADHLGLNESVPATCFPSAAGLASSWDRELIERVGEALGRESQAEGVSILLGPGANIKRSPLCGRNFEYFSEDPYLTGELAAAHIAGVQSQGVGTSLKHFAVNNQEHRRMTTNAVVDERTLREIYLTGFEIAVKKSQPWTVMSAYNRLNGTYCSENETLLSHILKEEWGHEGFVVSDWGAVNEAADSVAAGMELEMPASHGVGQSKIISAVEHGQLPEAALDRAVKRLLTVIFKAVDNKQSDASYDREAHHQLARETARETMVLLKNENQLLPLPKSGSVAVIGALAERVRYQGGGSSHINPTKLDNVLEELGKKAAEGRGSVSYAKGYELDSDETSAALLDEAKLLASQSETAVLFVGLPDRYESEGYDRTHLNLPANQVDLIEQLASVQPNLVVVLSNGAPIVMPWLAKVKAVLEAYLGGQAVGGAAADILFGDANPSGKLAETFPASVKQNPSHPYFPGEGDKVAYNEGIFVGYRYYEAKDIEPLFPFGYGLSYTSFAYSDLKIDQEEITDQETVQVRVNITNTGSRSGKEIVQLYVRMANSSVIRPEKELKGFAKISLEPGEQKTVAFTLDMRSFAYYNTELKDWCVESGAYTLLIGSSSREMALSSTIQVQSTVEIKPTYHRNTTLGELMENPKTRPILDYLQSAFSPSAAEPSGAVSSDMMMAMMRYMPLRALMAFSNGAMNEQALSALLKQLNQAVGHSSESPNSQGGHTLMAYTDKVKIGQLLEDTEATSVLAKHLPEFVNEPMFKMAASFTLDQLAALPQVTIAPEVMQALKDDLSKLSFKQAPSEAAKPAHVTSTTAHNLEGKVIIVTGAGSGIGRASSLKMAAGGAKMVVVDFNEHTGLETLELINSAGGEGIFVKADVSSSEDVQHYVRSAVETFGKIDVLFNNAGMLQKFTRFQDIPDDAFSRVIDVNLKGIFLGMKYVLQVMDKQGYGNIINTASTTAIRAEHSLAAYTASKHGVAGLTKAAAIEYVRKGIRVNAICPGGVATALTDSVPQQLQESGYVPEEFPNMRIGRYAQPEELAEVVTFLASDSSSYMTGSIVVVDGGLTL